MNQKFGCLVLAALALGFAASATAAPVKTTYSTVDLIAEQASLPADGGGATIGLNLKPDATWHAYWSNPGDAGKEPTVKWTLPEGFEVGEFSYPPPHLLPFAGLNTYGYKDAILLIADLTVPAGLQAGASVELKGAARWVVCDDKVCVPERATLTLNLDVGDGGESQANAALFAKARAAIPPAVDWPAQFSVADGRVNIEVASGKEVSSLDEAYLFVETKKVVKYGTQSSGFTRGGISFAMEAGRQADSITVTDAVLSYQDSAGGTQSVTLTIERGSGPTAAMAAGSGEGVGFWQAALYAFLGGLILNLMPCVFPILSMKALSLVNMANQDQRAARESGILYTVGVLVAFAAIGMAILGFRAAGNAVYWGFQFQNGPVNMLVAMLMVVIGLNLLGVFEVGGRVMGVGQELTRGGERKAAFFTGLLAVVVATPCGAPFMATAIGFAFQQTAAILVTIFLALGFGLAFPYLLLSFVPNIGRKLPKPGRWMETFKHVLVFPMFLAALYFFWVGGRVLGVSSMAAGIATALVLSFALWAYGRRAASNMKGAWNVTAIVGLLVAGWTYQQIDTSKVVRDEQGHIAAGTLGGLELEHFDPDRVLQYIADGQPVFVYFTADWCISCKANEKVALSTDTVADAFNSRGIKVVEGDWTLEDPAITEWLKMYDRVGVPLYLYFPQGSSLETVTILPQILTPGLVVDHITAADAATETLSAATSEEADDELSRREAYLNFQVPDAPPDWAPVRAYIDLDTTWHKINDEIIAADMSLEEKDRRKKEERGPHPEILDAQAAATAIVKLGSTHEKARDAALFLIEHTRGAPGGQGSMMLGLQTLTKHQMGYDHWPTALFNLDFASPVGWFPEVDVFFDDYERTTLEEPLVRATARYYAASRQMRLANAVDTPAADRPGYRERGIEIVSGLSKGVEQEELIKRRRFTDDGEPIPFPTLAEAEEDLLYNLNFLTVGNTIPDVSAVNLAGVEETIVAYRGQTVLLDFWATWCGPCVASLPKLEQLSADLPPDQFEILSISVDEFVSTVAEFQESKPMPWANWHIGPKSEILQTWAVRGYPTYILIDHGGKIIARQHDMNEDFMALIGSTTCKSGSETNCQPGL